MSNKSVDNGSTVNYTNGSGSIIPAGTMILMSHTLGVALADIAVGGVGAVQVSGKVIAPKVSAAVFAVGEKLIWDISAASGAGEFDDSSAVAATGDITGAAIAAVAGAATETTCTVILTPGNATKT